MAELPYEHFQLPGPSGASNACWGLVLHLFKEGFGFDLATDTTSAAERFAEVWYRGDTRDPWEVLQPWDVLVLATRGPLSDHVGLIVEPTLHGACATARGGLYRTDTTLEAEAGANCALTKGVVVATLLLDTPPEDQATPAGATLKVLLSPVRGADGQWRVLTQAMPVGVPVADGPACRRQTWNRLICNGRVLDPDEYADLPRPAQR